MQIFHTPYTIQVRKQYHDKLELVIAGELDETNAEEAFLELNSTIEKKTRFYPYWLWFFKTQLYQFDNTGLSHRVYRSQSQKR